MTQLVEIFNEDQRRFYAEYAYSMNREVTAFSPYMHGFCGTSQSTHNKAFTMLLRKHGCSTFPIEARHSNSNESDGELEDFTVGGHVSDLKTARAWVKREHPEWLVKKKFLYAGHSMGGYAAVAAGADDPEDLTGVVSICPFISGELFIDDFPADVRAAMKAGIKHSFFEKSHPTSKSDLITDRHCNEWRTHDLRERVADITFPVFFILGEKDTLTKTEHTLKLIDRIQRTPKARVDFRVIKGADHQLKNDKGDVMIHEAGEAIFDGLKMVLAA